MVYTVERLAIIALLAYSLALTARHFSLPPAKLFELCGRDFHEPAAKGSCLCRAGEFCMCTPGLAADVILELEDRPGGGVRGVAFVVRGDGRGLAMVGGFVKVGESVGIQRGQSGRLGGAIAGHHGLLGLHLKA